MPLTAGTRLGPYEVIAPIGAGGMGEVYRAKDTRLDRSVAIKILPQHLSSNPELRQRFEREAKSISALNHPHICALFDVGNAGDVEYLVMELLEGEALSSRLARGPLPLEDFLRYSREIASALERAHRSGIIHRDLKPGNIFITKSGAKLVDFGLAKMASAEAAAVSPDSATMQVGSAAPVTAQGTILGTVPYMAPEQLEGKPADARSDIFSFGAVMYEMATGKRAFRGDNTASLIASIMSSHPAPVRQQRTEIPPHLEQVIAIALRKDPDERWQSAHDIGLQLEAAPTPTAPEQRRLWPLAMATILAVLAASAITWWLASRGSTRSGAPVFADIAVPQESMPFLSPDGSVVTYLQRRGTEVDLFFRSIRDGSTRRVANLGGFTNAFWSRDSGAIYYNLNGKLLRFARDAESATSVARFQGMTGGCEEEDGSLLVSGPFGSAIMRVAADGTATPASDPPQKHQESLAGSPVCIDGTARFLYLARVAAGSGSAVYFGGDGRERKKLLDADALVGMARGHVIYVRDSVVYAAPVDVRKEVVTGTSSRIVDHVDYVSADALAGVSMSAEGALVYGDSAPLARQFSEFSTDGRKIRDIGAALPVPGDYASAPKNCSQSYDRLRFACRALNRDSGGADIAVVDVTSGAVQLLSSDPSPKLWPIWDRNDRTIYYSAERHGYFDIYAREYDSASADRELVRSTDDKPVILSPKVGTLLWRKSPDPQQVIYEFAAGRSRDTGVRGRLRGAVVSDAQQIVVYQDDDPLHPKLFAALWPSVDRTVGLYSSDGASPSFAPDGRTLYFWDTGKDRLARMSVSRAGDRITASSAELLPLEHSTGDILVGVTAGGTLIIGRGLETEYRPTRYISDWTSLLGRK